MGLSDSRQGPAPSYLFLLAVYAPAGLPGSSADLSTRAALSHPEESDDCSRPLLRRRFQASSSLADWPLSSSVTRPKQVRLRCGSRFALQGFASGITPTHACSATCRTGNLQDILLSEY